MRDLILRSFIVPIAPASLLASVVIATGGGCGRKPDAVRPEITAEATNPSQSTKPKKPPPEAIVTLDVEGKPLHVTRGRAEWFHAWIFITLTKDDFTSAARAWSVLLQWTANQRTIWKGREPGRLDMFMVRRRAQLAKSSSRRADGTTRRARSTSPSTERGRPRHRHRDRDPQASLSMAEESLWPAFQGQPLDGDRTWSATFDSYDQYHDVCYYAIRIHRAGAEVASFTVKMAMDVEPTDVAAFRAKLAALAASGKTNTDHVAYALR